MGSASATGAPTWRAGELKSWERDFLVSGVVKSVGGALAVTQRGAGANMSVDVAIGRALYQITTTLLTPNETHKILHDSDAVVNVPISTADPTNPRIDIIVMTTDMATAPDSSAGNIPSITRITGTPAGSPAVPATPTNYFKLAEVAVAAGATSVVNANITDKRAFVTVNSQELLDLARATETASIRDGSVFGATTTGSANAYAATYSNLPSVLSNNLRVFAKANFLNTGAATFNFNGTGAVAIKKQGATALSGSEIPSGYIMELVYDGTNWQLLNPANSGSAISLIKRYMQTGVLTTTSANPTFVDIDGTNFAVTATCTASTILIATLSGSTYNSGVGNNNYFDLMVNGSRVGDATVGLTKMRASTSSYQMNNAFTHIIVPGSGSIAVKPQWCTDAGTASLSAGSYFEVLQIG